ncbi:MAG TPA: GDP-L-fucose synthase [Candidatus Nanoarchaeia archaeon]|nr:GDP-L-fucose synthase [Candidatus Nanoarchaeia archaeon]
MDKKRVLVTGGTGFLGKHLCDNLRKGDKYEIITFTRKEYDITKEEDVRALFQDKGPIDFVIHAAALVGGIGFNKENPGRVYYENIMMNTLLQEYARRNNVAKFVGVGSVCSYPKITPVPFKEEALWEGYPEETNAPYGLSKKSMLVQSQSYAQQYGFNAIHLVMVNLYGPHDHFDLETSHVIPALIRKFMEAKERETTVTLWGTGNASREFLYVEDAAEGIILALENYNEKGPVNLGSGMEISIRALAEKISFLVGFKGTIVWDVTKPDGQPRRCLDVSKAKNAFNFTAKTPFDEGLKKTIDWYASVKSSMK